MTNDAKLEQVRADLMDVQADLQARGLYAIANKVGEAYTSTTEAQQWLNHEDASVAEAETSTVGEVIMKK